MVSNILKQAEANLLGKSDKALVHWGPMHNFWIRSKVPGAGVRQHDVVNI